MLLTKKHKWSPVVTEALERLPRHVKHYIDNNVIIEIHRIDEIDALGDKYYGAYGYFGYLTFRKEFSEALGIPKQIKDTPAIWIDSRIIKRSCVIRTTLHEAAHAWLNHRKLPAGEKWARLLSKIWMNRVNYLTKVGA